MDFLKMLLWLIILLKKRKKGKIPFRVQSNKNIYAFQSLEVFLVIFLHLPFGWTHEASYQCIKRMLHEGCSWGGRFMEDTSSRKGEEDMRCVFKGQSKGPKGGGLEEGHHMLMESLHGG